MKLLLCFLIVQCIPALGFSQTYSEIAQSAGILHSYQVENFGGGVSFYDFDQDGWDDLTIATASGDSIHFYKNMGGTFQKLEAFIADTSEIKQILWADVDNDGDKDLFTAVFAGVDYIYLNDGNFNFTPIALPIQNNKPNSKTFAGSFADIDLDGDLDLFVASRGLLDTLPNQLLSNDGFGNFTDITQSYFFDTIYQPTFCVAFLDHNRDSWPDIYTAEDRFFGQNQLYKNTGNGQYLNQTNSSGTGVWIDAMGLSVGDYNADGRLDMYISNSPDGNPLFHNNGDDTFTDTSNFAGVACNLICWGNQFLDFDNDNNLDLHVCTTGGAAAPDKNRLYRNLGNGTFDDVTDLMLSPDSTTSFSSALGDVNNDGYPDIAVNNAAPDSFQLWLNSGGTNNYIKLDLEGTISNRDAIGVWIEIHTGTSVRSHYTMCGASFQGQNSSVLMFGVGADTIIDSINVYWPSGIEDHLFDIASNQTLSILEGQTTSSLKEGLKSIIEIFPNPAENKVTIRLAESPDDFLMIVGVDGLFKKRISLAEKQTELVIDLTTWAPGIYFISVGKRKYKLVKI